MLQPNSSGSARSKIDNKKSLKVASAALVTTLAIAKESLDGVPAPGLKAAVGGLLEIIKTAKKTQENAHDLTELDVHLKDLSDVLRSINDTNQVDFTADLNSRVEKLTSDIQTIVESCRDLQSQSSAIKFFTSHDNASAISGISKSIDRTIQTFQLGVGMSTGVGIARIERRLDRLTTQASQDPNDPLNTLRPHIADARYDSTSRVKVSRCFEGTRSDLLQKIYDWADDPNAKSIYWLCGLAGTGKSTIAQTVAEALGHRKMLGASFFFSRDVAERSNPYLVFPTVAYQLGRFHKTFSSHISASVRDHPDACTSMLETQIEKLITEPLRSVRDAPPVVVIVIDALDECSNEFLVQEMLILLAAAIPKLPFHTRIFITSRPDIHIRSKFHEDVMKSVSEASLLHDIDLSIVQHDIKIYLEHHLRRIGEEMLRDRAWPAQDAVEVLVERARGLFIYASASLAYIGDKGYREPKERLNIVLADKPASRESPPYTEIDKLYRHILQSSLPQVGAWGVSSRLQPIIGTVVMLLDPLPVQTMEKLILVDEGSVLPLLTPLHAVLSVSDDPEEPIRVFHKSFPDFMLDPQRCTDSRLLIEPDKYHTNLALQCLNVMNSNLVRNMCGIQDPFVFNEQIHNLGSFLEERVGSHVIYACRFWASHLKHADPEDQTLKDALSVFVTTKILFWLEVMSLSKHVASALPSLKIVQNWYQEEEPRRLALVRKMMPVLGSSSPIRQYLKSSEGKLITRIPVKTLLHDLQCLILRFLDIITRSACHIYHSALPFAPDCLLERQFQYELRNSVHVMPREDTWDPALAVLKGHSGSVYFVCFSPDGLRIASGSHDTSLRLWDSTTGTHIRTMWGHSKSVLSVCFSPDGLRIASGSEDHTLCLWDSNTGAHIRTLEGHTWPVSSVCFSPNGLRIASGSLDNTLCLWDSTTGAHIRTLKGHSESVHSVCFSPDGLRIASGSRDNTLCLWDSTTGTHIKTMEGHSESVLSVCFSPDGRRIASGSGDNTLCLWDSITGAHIRTLEGHSRSIYSVSFSPDGSRIASGSVDGTLRLWDSSTGTHIRTLEGHSESVWSVCFSPDGLRIVSGSLDETLRLWDSTIGSHLRTLQVHYSSVRSINLSLSGKYICTQDTDGRYIMWDLNSSKQVHSRDSEKIRLQTSFHSAKELKSKLFLDKQSIFFFCSCEMQQHMICHLPFTHISCYICFDNQFVAGTQSGKVYILDFSSAITSLHSPVSQ